MITYLLCDWFTSNFVLVFVILILLLAFDFWTVKVCVCVCACAAKAAPQQLHDAPTHTQHALLCFTLHHSQNVTGRLLVGLRWWNNMKPDGSSEWVFESHQVHQQHWVELSIAALSLRLCGSLVHHSPSAGHA